MNGIVERTSVNTTRLRKSVVLLTCNTLDIFQRVFLAWNNNPIEHRITVWDVWTKTNKSGEYGKLRRCIETKTFQVEVVAY